MLQVRQIQSLVSVHCVTLLMPQLATLLQADGLRCKVLKLDLQLTLKLTSLQTPTFLSIVMTGL